LIILVLNCGSSSLKYQVYDWDKSAILATGIIERIAAVNSIIKHQATGKDEYVLEHSCPTHKEAIDLIMNTLIDKEVGAISSISDIKAVGHRVVHGGEKFNKSVLITDEVIKSFEEIADLAPLHNPANIIGIKAAQSELPDVPHCAIMDTAWHQTMPEKAFLYALPYEWYKKYGVRRYGFHGTSFLYTAKRAAALLGKDPFETNLIIAHIGNGSSINAVKNGQSFDTSMGLTPLEGLVMGTRCGDQDPAIPFYMMKKAGMSAEEVENALNKKSGVLGITEEWTDRRDIEIAAEEGHKKAILAQEMESYRIRKYIGSYAFALGRVDAIVFTAGVGERGPVTRLLATQGLEEFGIKIDPEKNKNSMSKFLETEITAPDSKIKVFVIPTDEELVMTEDTKALLDGTYDVHTNFKYSFQDPAYENSERIKSSAKDIKKFPGLVDITVKGKK
jgi:acetate kinase